MGKGNVNGMQSVPRFLAIPTFDNVYVYNLIDIINKYTELKTNHVSHVTLKH